MSQIDYREPETIETDYDCIEEIIENIKGGIWND